MTDSFPQIEILGQKMAYPNTTYGASAVLFFCIAFVLTVLLVTSWAKPQDLIDLQELLVKASNEVNAESTRNSELQNVLNERDATIQTLQKELDDTILELKNSNELSDDEIAKINAREAWAKLAVADVKASQKKREAELLLLIAEKERQNERLIEIAEDNPEQIQTKIYSGQQQQRIIQYKSQLEQLKNQQQQQQQQQR